MWVLGNLDLYTRRPRKEGSRYLAMQRWVLELGRRNMPDRDLQTSSSMYRATAGPSLTVYWDIDGNKGCCILLSISDLIHRSGHESLPAFLLFPGTACCCLPNSAKCSVWTCAERGHGQGSFFTAWHTYHLSHGAKCSSHHWHTLFGLPAVLSSYSRSYVRQNADFLFHRFSICAGLEETRMSGSAVYHSHHLSHSLFQRNLGLMSSLFCLARCAGAAPTPLGPTALWKRLGSSFRLCTSLWSLSPFWTGWLCPVHFCWL